MIISSHVKIIAFQTITNHSFWTFYTGGKPVVYIINRKIHGCLEIPDLFLVLNTRNKLLFLRTHVLFSTYLLPLPQNIADIPYSHADQTIHCGLTEILLDIFLDHGT